MIMKMIGDITYYKEELGKLGIYKTLEYNKTKDGYDSISLQIKDVIQREVRTCCFSRIQQLLNVGIPNKC